MIQSKYAETLLNDILHLSDDQILNSKIGLIMFWEGVSYLTRWYESDENNHHTDFTYYSHQAVLCKRLEHCGKPLSTLKEKRKRYSVVRNVKISGGQSTEI